MKFYGRTGLCLLLFSLDALGQKVEVRLEAREVGLDFSLGDFWGLPTGEPIRDGLKGVLSQVPECEGLGHPAFSGLKATAPSA